MFDRRSALKMGAAALALLPVTKAFAADQKLNALFDQFMKENLDLSPLTVSSLGLDTGARAYQKSLIDDASLAGNAKGKALTASQLARLTAFNRASLSGADLVNYDVVLYGLQTQDAANKQFQYGGQGSGAPYILSQLTGSYQQAPSFLDNQHTIETKADADAYLARLSGFATRWTRRSKHQHDIALGVVPPDFVLVKTLLQMQQLRAPAPEKSPLVEWLVRRAKEKNIAGDYAGQAAKIVADKVYPALDRQIALVKQMQQHAVHDAGVWRLPEGEDYYRASLVNWATTDKTAAEIHQLGLDIVKDHTARIDTLMKAQGMTKGTVGERLRAMTPTNAIDIPTPMPPRIS